MMNKKSLLLIVIMGMHMGPLSMLYANPTDSSRISDNRINLIKAELIAQEYTRSKIQLLTTGAVGATLGWAFWNYWIKPETQLAQRLKDLDARINWLTPERRAALEALQNGNQPAAQVQQAQPTQAQPQQSWLGRMGSWIKNSARDLKNAVPGFFKWIVQNEMYIYISMLSSGALPKHTKVFDYLFETRSIQWYVNKRTQLESTAASLIDWLEKNTDKQPDDLSREELKSIVDLLALEGEKVLGFMAYITDKLMPTQIIERSRAFVIQKRFRIAIHALCSVADQLIEKKTEPVTMSELESTIKPLLISIAQSAEQFRVVDKMVGLEDVVEYTILGSIIKRCQPKKDNRQQMPSEEEFEEFMKLYAPNLLGSLAGSETQN